MKKLARGFPAPSDRPLLHDVAQWVATTIALLAFAAASAGSQEDVETIRRETGVSLPEEIVRFVRGSTIDYERERPGLGTAVHYDRGAEFHATLYVFTANLAPFPTSIDDPAVVNLRTRAGDALLFEAKKRDPRARSTQSLVWNMTTEGASTRVATDLFIVYQNGLATNDFLYLWIAKDHIWKLRITRMAAYQGSESATAFAKALVQLSLAD